jgi:hypothetical protein
MTTIDLCFHVFKFQKRLKWVLSSLNQQIDNPFTMNIKISVHKSDEYQHLINEYKTHFKNLNITVVEYNDDSFGIRGKTRTDLIKICESEWILFLDADNVFHPLFFNKLHNVLSHIDDSAKTKIISVPRLTMDAKAAYKLISKMDKTVEIESVYDKASNEKTWLSYNGRISGAGYFQLVHVPTMNNMGIKSYVDGVYDTTIFNKEVKYATKSDIVFRSKFAGVYGIKTLPLLVHLNHYRRSLDKEYNFNHCN